jgi:hypothetical protein
MPSIEVLVAILGGALTVISVLGGVVWNMLREESKEHSELISKKADADRVHEIEARWQAELTSVKEGNERLIDKLSQRHDRELDQLSTRLSEQIRNTEANILTQIRLMVQVLEKK